MKPNRTAHILRKILKDLNSKVQVDSSGFVTNDNVMPDPYAYTSSQKFATDYLAYNIARKREVAKDIPPSEKQMKTALSKWTESEWRCRTVNQCGWWVLPIDVDERNVLGELFQRTAFHISRILCDAWPELDFNPTSGATCTTSKSLSFAFTKVDGMPLELDKPVPHKCATSAKHYLHDMFLANPGVASRFHRERHRLLPTTDIVFSEQDIPELVDWLCENVPPARLSHVNKNVDEVRLIALSNSLSIMVQKTFGDVIRKCLKQEGVDLDDQSVNQEWAEIGSHTGLVATVDLSAASDSISLHMLSLFPKRWQQYVANTRDSHVTVNGKVCHELNMIAGMGNGLIFELESLLFYAMSLSVVEHLGLDTSWVTVYGDDIIIPSRAQSLLETMFLSKGFLLNKEKSFASGPFRESCGKHYFNGDDVSPWFVRGDVDNVTDLYHLINGLSSWELRTGVNVRELISTLVDQIPRKERNLVPLSWGTRSGLHYICDGIQLPRKIWSKPFQRFVISWVAYKKDTCDVTARFPSESLLLTAWLVSAEMRQPLIDPSILLLKNSSKGYVPPPAGCCSPVWNRRKSVIWEPVTTRVTRVLETESCKRYRGESFEGDA